METIEEKAKELGLSSEQLSKIKNLSERTSERFGNRPPYTSDNLADTFISLTKATEDVVFIVKDCWKNFGASKPKLKFAVGGKRY